MGGTRFAMWFPELLYVRLTQSEHFLQNKCNVGYAFINMKDPSLIIPFYQVRYTYILVLRWKRCARRLILKDFEFVQAFNGKKWEKFNSEKVASLAFARIQGIAALIAHFQNSSLMNEDKRCRPILFNTDGPNAGDQVCKLQQNTQF